MAEWVPARAVLALLLWAGEERAECVPIWVVLICDCKDGVEVDLNDAPGEVKAKASCERGRTGAALTGIPWRESSGQIEPRVLVAAVVLR